MFTNKAVASHTRPPEWKSGKFDVPSLVQQFRKRRAARQVKFLGKVANGLPSDDQLQAAGKRLGHYKSRLGEGSNWEVSKRVMEVRLAADERLRLMDQCVGAASRAKKLDSELRLSNDLVDSLSRVLGKKPSSIEEVEKGLQCRRAGWEIVVADARQVRQPVFATQAFFRLSERSGLAIASLVIGTLIALGAIEMLFFYQAAAQQFVFHYWVWDDLIVQAINVAPIAALVLIAIELLFRVVRWVGEKFNVLGPGLFMLKHPLVSVLLLLVVLALSASMWGHESGKRVLADFKETKGSQSATMMDNTVLKRIHLVGTTSRAAVFLQVAAAGKQRVKNEDTSGETDGPPSYRGVVKRVFCELPFMGKCRDGNNQGKQTYHVYVMDRDKIVCHAMGDRCETIPKKDTSNAAAIAG